MIDPTLPRIDLHRHMDGNVRLTTILELGAQHGIALPGTTIETLRPHVQVPGVMPDLVSWLEKLHWMMAVMADVDAVRRFARENVEDAQRDGLDYVELRFSPGFIARAHGLDPAAVVEAVVAGVAEGCAATGMLVNLIGILSRTYGPDACTGELEALLAHRDHIAARDAELGEAECNAVGQSRDLKVSKAPDLAALVRDRDQADLFRVFGAAGIEVVVNRAIMP